MRLCVHPSVHTYVLGTGRRRITDTLTILLSDYHYYSNSRPLLPPPTTTTTSKVQSESSTGSVDSQKIRLTLVIRVETVDFDQQVCTLRVNGRVCEESQHVKMGAYHTIDLELHRPFTLTKLEWDLISLERIRDCCDVTKRADISAVVMQDGRLVWWTMSGCPWWWWLNDDDCVAVSLSYLCVSLLGV